MLNCTCFWWKADAHYSSELTYLYFLGHNCSTLQVLYLLVGAMFDQVMPMHTYLSRAILAAVALAKCTAAQPPMWIPLSRWTFARRTSYNQVTLSEFITIKCHRVWGDVACLKWQVKLGRYLQSCDTAFSHTWLYTVCCLQPKSSQSQQTSRCITSIPSTSWHNCVSRRWVSSCGPRWSTHNTLPPTTGGVDRPLGKQCPLQASEG